jgi:uncharacterized protein YutE (UPF0331/DUF86 family)
LSALETYLAELRTLRTVSQERFLAEPAVHHLTERYLHLSCECVLDIAHHLIADLGLRQPTTYKDTMDVLVEENLLTEALGERLKRWMGFRNLLVHFYLTLDHTRVFRALQSDLGDLEDFAASASALLED